MVFVVFCLGALIGSFLTIVIVLYWQTLVERLWLPPDSKEETPKIVVSSFAKKKDGVDIPFLCKELDVHDADNPKVWLGCVLQFLFAELKDTERMQKWFREKLIIEVEELKEKLPSRFVKDLKVRFYIFLKVDYMLFFE